MAGCLRETLWGSPIDGLWVVGVWVLTPALTAAAAAAGGWAEQVNLDTCCTKSETVCIITSEFSSRVLSSWSCCPSKAPWLESACCVLDGPFWSFCYDWLIFWFEQTRKQTGDSSADQERAFILLHKKKKTDKSPKALHRRIKMR